MFTGLIEAIGHVARIEAAASGVRLHVATDLALALAPGESVAVNGVCLTATDLSPLGFAADVGPETARVSTLGALREGQALNLERAMRADSRLGGHFVQGHVDATGVLEAVRADGEAHWITIAHPASMAPLLVPKGSIAVDGISLTVASLGDDRFDVMIIPFTWAHTTLPSLRAGDRVNLEGDLIGKYVARSMALAGLRPAGPDPGTGPG
jgi:riboflavin synthase